MPPSLLSRFSSLRTRSHIGPSKTHITSGPDLPKTEVGPAKDVLRDELLRLYWDGVKQDLPHIVSSLRNILSMESPIEEEKDVVHEGYDQWIDNITQSTQEPPANLVGPHPIDVAFHRHAWNVLKEAKQRRQREEIRSKSKADPSADILKQRARLLLQSAQWLDLDKLIEHRDPPPEARLSPTNFESEPSKMIPGPIETQRCRECNEIMRGPEFAKVKVVEGFKPGELSSLRLTVICEKCYCDNHYGEEGFAKRYKHSGVQMVSKGNGDTKVCQCGKFNDDLTNGSQQHWGPECPIGRLRDRLAERRFESTRLNSERRKSLAAYQKLHSEQDLKLATDRWRDNKKMGSKPVLAQRTDDALVGEFEMDGLSTSSPINATPDYLRPASSSNPWGLVHMSLRIGPLVIENGVEK